MIKKIFVMMLGILLLINMISNVSSGLQFFQTKDDLGNKTINNRMTFCYDKRMSSDLGDIKDYVTGNNFFQAYIIYSIYVRKWNSDNPDYIIDYCNLTLKQSSRQTNYSQIYNQMVTGSDYDVSNAKYFFLMKDGDCVVAEEKCRYNIHANQSGLDIPAEMQLVTPTWECKACQYYSWYDFSRKVDKTNLINANTISVSTFIKDLFLLNFEILLMIFWVFTILMLFVAVGLIFIIFYWLFIFLKRLAR